MAKFILSMRERTFETLVSEAEKRDVTVQQLLRAVIVPDWVRENVGLTQQEIPLKGVAPHLLHESIYPDGRDQYRPTPVNRIRT